MDRSFLHKLIARFRGIKLMKNRKQEVDAAVAGVDFSKNKYQVKLETSKGEIVIDMWITDCP